MRSRWFFAAVLAASSCVLASGCATAEPSPHKGLFDGSEPRARAAARPVAAARPAAARAGSRIARPRIPTGPGNPRPLSRPAVEIVASTLRWPLQSVHVTSAFGRRGREVHEGIDLKAAQGTPVLAAQDGTVIYAGDKIHGYGKLVVIRHWRQISTIYGHCSRLLVRRGQYVRQGQQIAESGQTGHVTGPHLHFEVRDGLVALNPLGYLPALRAAPSARPARSGSAVAAARVPARRVAASAADD